MYIYSDSWNAGLGREDSEPRDGFCDEGGAFKMPYQWQPWQNTNDMY